MYIFIYICTYIYIYICTYIYIVICTYIYIFIYIYVHIFICTYIQYRFIYELSLPLCLLAPPLDAGLLSDWMNPCVHPSGSQRTDVMRGQQRDPRWVPRCRSHWGPAGGLTWSLSLQQLAAPCPTSGPGPPPCTTWASGLWGSAGSSWSQVRPPDHFL